MQWWIGVGLGALAVGLVVGMWWGRRRREAPTRVSYGEVSPQLRSVIGMLKAGGLAVGPHDEVIYSNSAARSFSLARGDRVVVPEILDLVRDCRATGLATTQDIEIRRGASGPALHLTVRVAAIEDDVVVVLAEDRTPLLRVDETRRDFVANVSHELKTPIGAISLLAEAVSEASDDPDAVEHFAARLQRESSRLADLVAQIIELSRLQSEDPMLGNELTDVDDVIEAAIDNCRELAVGRQVTIATTGDESLALVCDPIRLQEAVANLLQNAIVYSDEGSRVAINYRLLVEGEDEFVVIAVADNGIGIKAEEQERIFERFYRVDYARSRESGGTGLGLSIVKHIAALHGGTVSVWSRPGHGSTFTLRLPRLDPVIESDMRSGASA